MRVLEQAPIADFRKAKDALDDADDVLHLGPYLGLGAILLAFDLVHVSVVAVPPVGEVLSSRGVMPDHGRLAPVGLIAIHPCLLPMQQLRQHGAVGHVGRSGLDGMNQLGPAVHAQMRLHPEVPLAPLGGLVHLRVPRLIRILGGTWRVNDGGIHDGARRDGEAAGTKVGIDGLKECRAELMSFQQVPEPADGGLIRHRFRAEINPGEGAHGSRVVQGLFDRRVRQIEPLLEEIDTHHPLQPHRAAPRALGFRIHRLDDRTQRGPGHHLVHFGEKHVPASGLAKAFKSGGRGEGQLGHARISWREVDDRLLPQPIPGRKNYSDLP